MYNVYIYLRLRRSRCGDNCAASWVRKDSVSLETEVCIRGAAKGSLGTSICLGGISCGYRLSYPVGRMWYIQGDMMVE